MALTAWMRIGQPLEAVMMPDYRRTLDAWEAGGVTGLVVGRLLFEDADGQFTVPAYPTRPDIYRRHGLAPRGERCSHDPAKLARLHALLDDAKRRGWTVLFFEPTSGSTGAQPLPVAEDPTGARALAAAWEEAFDAFPQVDGGIQDGWTESAYELVYHHGNAVFRELSEPVTARAIALGYDPERLRRGLRHLSDRFRSFAPAEVRYYGAHGCLAALNLFDIDEDSLYWLRWRRANSLAEGRAFRAELDRLPRRLLLANCPRSAAFSGMTALDYVAWAPLVDFLLVKHYFWHRGFDGMYGTVARWIKQIHRWNPSLTEADCFVVVKAWLGIDLPGIRALTDLELGFPQAFFDQVVTQETARAIAATQDPLKVVPWVDTGRLPHGGDPMTAGDLHRILVASESAGLRRFLFHNHAHLTSAEWTVISRLCGTPWDEDPDGYWPPNTPKPATYG
ncbi:MAG: hypothetical protein GX557_03160 [Chloroflexi bacterium]|nr:hypothetical protein [Chloroflexota bacterium]